MCPQCFRAHLHPVVSLKLKQRQPWPCKIFLWLCRYYQLKLCSNGRGQQCLEFLTSVLPVDCTRMQQLPTMLGPAVHRGKDTTHKALKTVCTPRAWPQQLMFEEVCKRIQHCCATLRRSQKKRNVGSCYIRVHSTANTDATTSNIVDPIRLYIVLADNTNRVREKFCTVIVVFVWVLYSPLDASGP